MKRRYTKIAEIIWKGIRSFLWDGNTILHEWETDADSCKKPQQKIDYQADYVVKLWEQKTEKARTKPAPESLVTWIFQDDFIPRAKITKDGCYSIMTDYLGTPVGAYDESGNQVWELELDINGKVMPAGKDSFGRTKKEVGEKNFIPFRFQGQYEDEEIGLYYNRFRYYNLETGQYTQQDPIGLAGGNPTLYGYVWNTLNELDPFGLSEDLIEFTKAMKMALEWLEARGFKAEVVNRGRFGEIQGKPVGMKNTNGKIGFRILLYLL